MTGQKVGSAGRVALVTGGGTGVGKAIALALGQNGWSVIIPAGG